MKTDNQPERLIVLPPTHEQSTPSYHVVKGLAAPFLAFLKTKGVTAWQPPEVLEKHGPGSDQIVEIEIEAGTPVSRLEAYMHEFLEKEKAGARP